LLSLSPTRGDTTLSRLVQVSLDLEMKMEVRLKALSRQGRQRQVELTSLDRRLNLES
jgi:hypothetical protein